jgi:serine beta-lactamase-like protein LACTB
MRLLMERADASAEAIAAWLREAEDTDARRRRDGILLGAFALCGAGGGALIALHHKLFRDDAVPAWISFGIGAAMFLYLFFARKRSHAAMLIACVALAFHAGAAPWKEVESIAREEMKRLSIPGMQVVIARDGKIVYSAAYGLADVEKNTPVTRDTRFRTASVAKSITATAVMQLADEGKIDLDAPIQAYCPAFPHPVTARQLLAHTSGVRHYAKRGESRGSDHYFTIEDSLKLFKDDPLLFEPGTQFGYTTYGYSILGCAIEGASKMPFDEYLQAHVFAGAGMNGPSVDDTFLVTPRRASFYYTLSANDLKGVPPAVAARAHPGMLLNAPFHDTSMKRAGGGLLSTAEDLVRFALAFEGGRLVRPETVQAMWTVQKTSDGKEIATPWGPLGLGWFIRKRGERTEIYSSGGQIGARASMYVFPEERVVLAVMTNLTNAEIIPMEDRILALLIPGLMPYRTAPVDRNLNLE